MELDHGTATRSAGRKLVKGFEGLTTGGEKIKVELKDETPGFISLEKLLYTKERQDEKLRQKN